MESCIKKLEDPKKSKMVRNILTNDGLGKDKTGESKKFHTTQIPFTEQEKILEEMKLEYDIQDDEIILRIWELKQAIREKKQKMMSDDEILTFLRNAMNYGDMQIWLMKEQIEGIELTLNDELKKFFELKSNDDILRLYDIEQNYDQNNIDEIGKILKKI